MHTCLAPQDLMADMPIGGKAEGLRLLDGLDAPVPAWGVFPVGAARSPLDDTEASDTLSALFHSLDGGAGLAVRSSGVNEDQRGASRAGAYETRFCGTADGLPDAIKAVLDSGEAGSGMAVILQQRIEPLISGVLFSAHPSRARLDRAYVEIVAGTPVGLVDGTAAPHRVFLDLDSGKPVVGDGDSDLPSDFSEDIAQNLCGWLRRVERAFACAVDIEWAVDDRGLWLLQARPITRLYLDPGPRPPVPATSWFFDQRFADPIR
ncbi:MAG: PEP/pyruvate-binding domain-containing protein, partial [Candidatus Hydrogenedentes bacterium]|nr:PEP/pyruvate-binding domain-containing protein [Candidatus Hydrogenedentota bacterium]